MTRRSPPPPRTEIGAELHVNGSFHTAQKLGIVDHLERYRPGLSPVVVTVLSGDSFPKFDSKEMEGQGDFVVVTDPSLPRSYTMEGSK